jgi:hypothetical protein
VKARADVNVKIDNHHKVNCPAFGSTIASVLWLCKHLFWIQK